MSQHAWETLSNQAVAAAGIVYFLALIATLVEWSSLLGRSVGRGASDSAQAESNPSALAATGARGGLDTAPLVPHGAGSTSGGAGSTNGGAGSTNGAGSTSGGAGSTSGGAGSTGATADDERERRTALFERLGYLLAVIGAVCHAVAVVSRGFAADRVPWGNMYEFTLTGTCIVAVAYVLLYPRLRLAWMAPLAIAFVLVFLMVDVLVLYVPAYDPLSEALHSYWLVIHVIAAATATGAFTLGGMTSVMYLIKSRRPDTATGWLARVPALPTLDRVAYRIIGFGFPVWTFAVLIAGPIWAHQAWGSYWNWDPKEVWAFITWVVYAGYLHARATAGWRGRNAAILALVGVATLWFNFVGINYFSTSSQHSYADAPVVQTLR